MGSDCYPFLFLEFVALGNEFDDVSIRRRIAELSKSPRSVGTLAAMINRGADG